jgi:hypothetical protein
LKQAVVNAKSKADIAASDLGLKVRGIKSKRTPFIVRHTGVIINIGKQHQYYYRSHSTTN